MAAGGGRGRMGKRTVRELGMDMHTPLYLNGITNEACCTAQGTLLEVRQPGRQRGVRESGHAYLYG